MFAKRLVWILGTLLILPLGARESAGRACVLSGPRYQLASDTVQWSLTLQGGDLCTGGLRYNDVVVQETAIVSPPAKGKLTINGIGFSYRSDPTFQGDDSFAIRVSGAIGRKSGSSTIRIVPSIMPTSSPVRGASDIPGTRATGQSPEPGTGAAAGGRATVLLPRPASAPGEWRTLRIGGGGFVTGLSIAPDGTKAVRTDTFGGYVRRRGAGAWRQVVSAASLPKGVWNVDVGQNGGLYEIEICPNATSTMYMMFDGRVYVSKDAGASWQATAFRRIAGISANAKARTMGRFIACDPSNDRVVYVGTPSSGVFVTWDGGASFSQVDAVGRSEKQGNSLIAFDPTSGVVGGRTQGIFVSTYGSGVFHSTDGGATWGPTANSPTTHRHLAVDQDGRAWLTGDGSGANLHTYESGTWSTRKVADPLGFHAVAVDPVNRNRVVLTSPQGFMLVSSDGGNIFAKPSYQVDIGGDTPWQFQARASNPALSSGDIRFDPTQPGRLYVTWGYGVMSAYPHSSASSLKYTAENVGIEQLVATYVLAPPGARSSLVLGAEDQPAWYKSVETLESSGDRIRPEYMKPGEIVAGFSFDWAPGAPNIIVGLMNSVLFQGDFSGISSDGGNTWTRFRSIPPDVTDGRYLIGGNIAAASTTNYVWCSYGGTPYFTRDGGKTWTPAGGISNAASPQSFIVNQVIGNFLAADKVDAGTFYLYVAHDGVYRSVDGGAVFTKLFQGSLDPGRDGWSMVWRVSPFVAGDIWYSSGYQQGAAHPGPGPLKRSRDGGRTWSTVEGFQEVFAVGFGAQVEERTYPSIAVVGWFKGAFGIFQSFDDGTSWLKIGEFPLGTFQYLRAIDGDKTIQGQWYAAINGNGFVYYKPRSSSNALPEKQ